LAALHDNKEKRGGFEMKVWTVLAIAAVMLTWTAADAEEIKIGYVDLQRALNECQAGAKARALFKKEVDKYQSDLAKQKEELETLKGELEKKALVMKQEERRNLELEYQRKMRDFERAYKDSQGELQLKDNELTADILKELATVVREIGASEGYTLILEYSGSNLLYGNEDADLTPRVIEAHDQRK
jgi:outer membrane protein